MTATFKPFATAILCAALAVTSAPATADQRSYAHRHQEQPTGNGQAIGNILALLAFGAIVHQLTRDDDRDDRDDRRAADRGRNSAHVLPADCIRRFETNRGTRRLAIQRCLRRNDVRVNRLPDNCFRQLRTDRGQRRGFAVRCLRNEGYSFH